MKASRTNALSIALFIGGLLAASMVSHAQEGTLQQLLRVYPTPIEKLRASYSGNALPELGRMLDDPQTLPFRDNVVLAVGVVGGEAGTAVLIDYLERRFEREVNDDELRSLIFVPVALGSQAAGGNTKARDYLVSHHTLKSWRLAGVKWSHRTVHGEQIYRLLAQRVLGSMILCIDDPEVERVFGMVAQDTSTDYVELRRHVPGVEEILKSYNARRKARDQAPRSGAEVKSSNDVQGGAANAVFNEPPLTEAEAIAGRRTEGARLPDDEAVQLKALALEQYDSIAKVLLGDKPEDSLASLALQGKPVIDRSGKEDSASLLSWVGGRASLEKTREIAREVRALRRAGPQYGNPSAFRRTDGSLVIIIPVPGTEAIAKARLPRGSPSVTIIEGRILAVYMVKVGDRWYWNPFGW